MGDNKRMKVNAKSKGSMMGFPNHATAAGEIYEEGSDSEAEDLATSGLNLSESSSLPSPSSVISTSSSDDDSKRRPVVVGEDEESSINSFVTAADSSSFNAKLTDSGIQHVTSLLEDLKPGRESPSTSIASTSTGIAGSGPEETQIVQTKEAYGVKAESDRAKRFEFLLHQTEIWGHFMQPAYKEALSFAASAGPGDGEGNGGTPSTSQASGLNEAEPPGSANGKSNGRGRLRQRKQLPLPSSLSNGSQDREVKKNYVTHFSSTPSFIKWGSMRDYQVRGLNWLISLYERGLGGILADEMGLGKTLQAISLLGYLKHHREINGPHLIIAPKSTLANWMNEISRWCPSMKAICLIGTKEERAAMLKKTFLAKRWNICVTSYEIAKIERPTLSKINYHFIVIDEAQKIKNENSLLASVVRRLKSSARLLLTGTPLQNNLHELWSLLNFLLPDVFSSDEDFDSWFNESSCMGNQTLVERLHAVLRPFLLRRIKTDVEKTIPPKSEMRLYVQLTPMQREWYRKVLLNDIDIINSKTGQTTKKSLQNVIMHLRKVCNHPYLFEGAEPKPFTTDSHLVTNCGKMIVLDKLLQKLKAQNSRVLLFSQMTRVLDILEDYCLWRKFEYCRLDGDTDYDIRQEDIDAYNAPDSTKFIYLLSTRAGGLGINLATANIVILYDSDWNPQIDLQAMDRAHRIGQTKEVKVFRFVVQDTAEEKIVERAAAKLHLDRMVIQQGRLVGAGVKLPSAVEMLNVVRFGADKILKSGSSTEISDADIDTILAQSKVRSEELDRRINGMSEDNLQDLTIEQVEMSYVKPVVENEENIFNFEGQNYRELRKRKPVLWFREREGKRIKDKNTTNPLVLEIDDEKDSSSGFKESSEGLDPSFVIASPGGFKSSEHPAIPVVGSPTLLTKPNEPLDFQFCSPYIWELYWKELDYFYKKSKNYKLDLREDVLPVEEIEFLKDEEKKRLRKCEQLGNAEYREKQMLLNEESCLGWKKRHFNLLVKGMMEHGCENLQAVAKTVKGKSEEEVVCYIQRFWLSCHELKNAEEIVGQLGRPEVLQTRLKSLQDLLEKKIIGGRLMIKFEPERWRGHRFTSEDDTQLVLHLLDIGLETPDVFGVLRRKLIEFGKNVCSPFLRTRTKEELRTRFNLLIHMVEKNVSSASGGEATSSSKSSQKSIQNAAAANFDQDHRLAEEEEINQLSLEASTKQLKQVKLSASQSSTGSSVSVGGKGKSSSNGIGTPKTNKRKRVLDESVEKDSSVKRSPALKLPK